MLQVQGKTSIIKLGCVVCIYWVNAYNILGFVYIWYTPHHGGWESIWPTPEGGGVKWGEFMFTVPVYIME